MGCSKEAGQDAWERGDLEPRRQFIDSARTRLNAKRPEARCWDDHMDCQARRLFLALAGLPDELKRAAWVDLGEGDQTRIRRAVLQAGDYAMRFRGSW